jgi:hypothetical protein
MNNLTLKIKKNIIIYIVIFITIFPSIIWIFLDQSVFPWDQAWYGKVSIELFYRLTHSPLNWGKDMISALGIKAPGIAWLGQFFVPIGQLVGSIDIGLLLSIIATQFSILLLIYHTIFKLTDSRLISLVCCLFASSSPLSVGLTHQYFVEPLQTLSITWIILIMVFAPQWESKRIILHLISAISLSMIAKITSPLYSFGAVLVILYHVYNNRNINCTLTQVKSKNFLSKIKPLHITSLLLISGFLLWYGKNIQNILSFAIQASSGEASLLYGKKADFLSKMKYWLSGFQESFFIPICLILVVSLLLYIVANKILKIRKNKKLLIFSYFDICIIVCWVEIISILTFFSFSINEDNRYLLPLLPYVAIVLSWILKNVNQKIIVIFIACLFSLQLFVVQGQALGFTSVNHNLSYWLYPIDINNNNKQLLSKLVNATCSQTEKARYNIVGLELPWFNADSAAYFSAKQLLAKDFYCYYTSLGYAEKDIKKAWQRLFDLNINYFATLQPSLQPKPVSPFNQVSLSILERIQKSSKFKLDSSIDNSSILLYKQITP